MARLSLLLLGLVVAACSPGPSAATTPRASVSAAATPSLCPAVAYGKPCAPPAPPVSTPAQTVTSLSRVAFSDANDGLAVGSRCSQTCAILLSATKNGGSSWSTPQTAGTVPADQYRGQAVDVSIRFAGLNVWVFGPGVFASHDGGRSWRQTLSARILALEPDADSIWALEACSTDPCVPRLLVSAVGSDTWRPAASQPPLTAEPLSQLVSPGIVLERAPSGVAFLAGAAAGGPQILLASHDFGRSWVSLKVPCDGIVGVRSLDAVHVWVLCSMPCCTGNYIKSLYVSDDGGSAWRERAAANGTSMVGSIPFYGRADALVVTPLNVALFGASGEAGIWRSSDVGATWRPVFNDVCIGGGTAVSEIWFVNGLEGWAVAGGSFGSQCPSLLRTTNGGLTWLPIPSPLGAALGSA